MDIIKQIENDQLRENELNFRVGDTIAVDYRIKEGNRERIQVFEGYSTSRHDPTCSNRSASSRKPRAPTRRTG